MKTFAIAALAAATTATTANAMNAEFLRGAQTGLFLKGENQIKDLNC